MSSANSRQVGGDHYSKHKIQPWDVMQEYLSPEEFYGYLKGCVIKYVLREKDKGGVEDLQKACHYLEKMEEVLASKDEVPKRGEVGALLINGHSVVPCFDGFTCYQCGCTYGTKFSFDGIACSYANKGSTRCTNSTSTE